jgi:hypothetical protein
LHSYLWRQPIPSDQYIHATHYPSKTLKEKMKANLLLLNGKETL